MDRQTGSRRQSTLLGRSPRYKHDVQSWGGAESDGGGETTLLAGQVHVRCGPIAMAKNKGQTPTEKKTRGPVLALAKIAECFFSKMGGWKMEV